MIPDHLIGSVRALPPAEAIAAIRRRLDEGGEAGDLATSDVRALLAAHDELTAGLARLRAPADLAAVKARAAAAVDAIIADGSDRRGVLNLYACDDDIRDEIVATWRAAVAREIVAAVVENTGACNSHAVALLAAEREGHAAEVAGARAAALREAGEVCCAHANRYVDPALRFVAAQCGNAIAALTTKGAPDV